jgi:GxxExxY protein
MTENEISKIIVQCAYDMHISLGPGLLESVYEEVMHYKLQKLGLSLERQRAVPVIFEDIKMELGFRADLIVNGKVIVELKSTDKLADVHYKQVLTYLRLTGLKLGLLINFNEALIKTGIHRIVNNL